MVHEVVALAYGVIEVYAALVVKLATTLVTRVLVHEVETAVEVVQVVLAAATDEVIAAEDETEAVYEGPGAIVTVTGTLDEADTLAAVMWKGNEYWKVVGSESREILKP